MHILPHLVPVPLREVPTTVLRGHIATLESERSPRYTRQIRASLSNVSDTAVDDNRLVRNPSRAKNARRPKAKDSREGGFHTLRHTCA